MKKFFSNMSFDNGLDVFIGLLMLIFSIFFGIGFYFDGLLNYLFCGRFPLYLILICDILVSLGFIIRGIISQIRYIKKNK